MERGLGSLSRTKGRKKKGRNFLFAIGIDKYQHWPRLNNAVKDIGDISQVLVQQYQFEVDHVYQVTDEEATEANIYKKIRDLKREITSSDNLIFLYSGHGHYDKEFEEGYWVPVDARLDSEDRYISNSNIIKRVNALDTHHTLLIVDSCFSGTLVVQKRSGVVDESFKSRRILTSGRQETVADGRAGENSPFAAGIITYLKKNTEKAINTTSLVQYVKSYVHGKANQTPVEGRIQNSDDEGGEFVFHLKVTEAELWSQVEAKDQVQDYENYLDYFPDGQYAELARRRVLALKEDEIWQSTLLKDNELAYQTYIQKYLTSGKYLAEASKRLEEIQARHEERKGLLEELAKKDAERDQIARQFQALIKEAEALYADKKLKAARLKYRESQQFHMPGFVPTYEYIEERINLCHSGIRFLEHFDQGREAMAQQNFKLALQYFNEALKLDHNPKVEDLVRHCRQKLLIQQKRRNEPVPDAQTYTVPPPLEQVAVPQRQQQAPTKPAPARKKRSIVPWVIGGFLGLVLIAALIDQAARSSNAGNFPIEEQHIIPPESLGGGPDGGQPAHSGRSYQQLIIGSWRLVDMTSQGESVAQSFPGAIDFYNISYNFNSNGTVQGFSTTGNDLNNYSIIGSTIVIQSPMFGTNTQGVIQQLDDTDLVISYSMYNPNFGTYVPIVMELERLE